MTSSQKINSTKFLLLSIASACVSLNCGSGTLKNTATGSTNTSVSEATLAVTAQVGPVNEAIYGDIRARARDLIGDGLFEIVTETTGVTVGAGDRNFLVKYQATDKLPTRTYNDIDLTLPSEDCSGGGTKQISGTGTLTITNSSGSGTLSGNYDIAYTDCIENVIVNASDGTCSASVQFDGIISHDFTVTFSDLQRPESGQQTQTNTSYSATISSVAPILFANNSAPSQSATYSMNLSLSTLSNRETIQGGVTFQGSPYDPTDISDYLNGSVETSDVCE